MDTASGPYQDLVEEVSRDSQPQYTSVMYVAAKDIRVGTLVFSEEALAPRMPAWEKLEADLIASVQPWLTELIHLSHKDSEGYEKVQSLPRQINQMWYNMMEPQIGGPPEGQFRETLGTLIANSWLFPMGQKVAQIGHSCVPNVECYWNDTTQRVNAVAIRDIEQGEVLTTSQRIVNTLNRQDRRSAVWYRWGFDCNCAGCDIDQSSPIEPRELKLSRIADLSEKLNETSYGPGQKLKWEVFDYWCPVDRIYEDRAQVLGDLKELQRCLSEVSADSVRVGKVLGAMYLFKRLTGDNGGAHADFQAMSVYFSRARGHNHPLVQDLESRLDSALEYCRNYLQFYYPQN